MVLLPRRRRLWTVVSLLAALPAIGCSSKPSESRAVQSWLGQSGQPVIRNRAADDVARFLAGLPGKPGSSFADAEAQEEWKIHRREIDAMWRPVSERWLPAMTKFRQTELSVPPIQGSVIFYPFSGPDVLFPAIFFSNNRVCVMVGLEPAGTLPGLRGIEKTGMQHYLEGMREAVYSELHRSFFITREMDHDFRGEVTDGLTAPILLLLARSGHTLLDFRYVRLDEQGNLVERAADYRAPGKIGNKGIEIDYADDADHSVHKLYYFSVNLADDRLEANRPFLTYLARLKGMTTFLKATSYMLHNKSFVTIREQVLALSSAVLQDDSGIPYRFFRSGAWRIQLYGHYERPYGSFAYQEDPDLRAAYDGPAIKPLEFRIGYGFSRAPSNLLLAIRNDKIASRQGSRLQPKPAL